MSNDWKEDARFVGAFVRGGNWEVGLRIARSVEVPDPRSKTAPMGAGRVSMKEFSKEAGLSEHTVKRYLAAWEWAAQDIKGIDPAAETDCEKYTYDISGLSQEDWEYYYQYAMKNPAPWNPDGNPLRRKVTQEERRDEVVTEQIEKVVKSNPKAAKAAADALPAKTIVEKINTDREVEKEARKAVYQKDRENWEKQRPVADPHQDYDDSNKLLMRMRAAKMDLQEALSLSLKTAAAPVDIVTALAEDIRALLTAIEGAAHGDTLDNEIAALLGGGQ